MTNKKTSLYEEHIKLGANLQAFAGFIMPMYYKSAKEEVLSVRQDVGIFDVGHMGEFLVEGKEAFSFVDYMMTNKFIASEDFKAVYSPLCREDGTTIDDHIAYKIGPDKVLLCVNASNIEKDWIWFLKHKEKFDCTLTNKSNEFSLIAVQGPSSEPLLKGLSLWPKEEFKYYSIKNLNYQFEGKNYPLILAQTGYTGEKGLEIFCPNDFATPLWNLLIKNGAIPCGLASRDVLRLESCFPLYGHELSDELTPLDAALKWTVKLDKENFIGKDALSKIPQKFELVKLSLNEGVPRENYPVCNSKGMPIGKVSSGTFSPILNKGICLCLIEKSKMPEDKTFFVHIRGKNISTNIYKQSFIAKEGR